MAVLAGGCVPRFRPAEWLIVHVTSSLHHLEKNYQTVGVRVTAFRFVKVKYVSSAFFFAGARSIQYRPTGKKQPGIRT